MAQFDVYVNPSQSSRAFYPYLVDIQTPYIAELATRIVIPLGLYSAFGGEAMKGLTPIITFEDEKLLLLTPQMASLPTKRLHDPIGTLAHLRDRIIGAVDFALTGF